MLTPEAQNRFDALLLNYFRKLGWPENEFPHVNARHELRQILDAFTDSEETPIDSRTGPMFRLFASIMDGKAAPEELRLQAIDFIIPPEETPPTVEAILADDGVGGATFPIDRKSTIHGELDSLRIACIYTMHPRRDDDHRMKVIRKDAQDSLRICRPAGEVVDELPEIWRRQYYALKGIYALVIRPAKERHPMRNGVLLPKSWSAIWKRWKAAVVMLESLPDESDESHSRPLALHRMIIAAMRYVLEGDDNLGNRRAFKATLVKYLEDRGRLLPDDGTPPPDIMGLLTQDQREIFAYIWSRPERKTTIQAISDAIYAPKSSGELPEKRRVITAVDRMTDRTLNAEWLVLRERDLVEIVAQPKTTDRN